MIPTYEFQGLFEMKHCMCLAVVDNKPSFKLHLSNKAAAISMFCMHL